MPGYDRFSHHARRALTHAEVLTRRFRHPRVDTGHLLVGVLLAKGSIGHAALVSVGLNADTACEQLAALVVPLDKPVRVISYDAALDIALDLATDESAWLSHHYIGTEHMLLGITRTNVGNAPDLLLRLDISPEQVRQHVRAMLLAGMEEYSYQLVRRNARFSELARRVVNAAEQYANTRGDPGPVLGHLLLTMLWESRSPTYGMLQDCGVDEVLLQMLVNTEEPAALVDMQNVLAQSSDYAYRLGSHFVGTEHLLLAFVLDPAGAELLERAGGSPEELRNRVAEQLGNL